MASSVGATMRSRRRWPRRSRRWRRSRGRVRAVQTSPLLSFTCPLRRETVDSTWPCRPTSASTLLGVGSSPRRSRRRSGGRSTKSSTAADHGGDDDLQPDGRAEEVRDESDDAADAEHQEREIERQHLDDQEGRISDQPPDPRVLFDGLDELHSVPPCCSNLSRGIRGRDPAGAPGAGSTARLVGSKTPALPRAASAAG